MISKLKESMVIYNIKLQQVEKENFTIITMMLIEDIITFSNKKEKKDTNERK